MKKYLFYLGIILFVFAGCKKEEIEKDATTDKEDNNNMPTEQNIQGSWLEIYEDAFLGPNDDSCDVIIMEIQEQNYTVLTFLRSDPASGTKGTYTYNNIDTFTMNINSVWEQSIYNWSLLDSSIQSGLELSLSSDEDTLYVQSPAGLLTLQRVTSSLPQGLVSTWEIPDYATMTFDSTGGFTWVAVATETEGETTQSGTTESLGSYKGHEYLLTHITYCEYEAGENDYYTFNRYALGADSLHLWHGTEQISLSKPN